MAPADLTIFEDDVWPRWERRFRTSKGMGSYAFLPGKDAPSLYGSSDMVLSQRVLGLLDVTAAEAAEWAARIQAFQDPTTGDFVPATYEPHAHSDSTHPTAFATAALRLLHHAPQHRLARLEQLAANASAWDGWLSDVGHSWDHRVAVWGLVPWLRMRLFEHHALCGEANRRKSGIVTCLRVSSAQPI